jgi:hypothetical protein
MCLQSSTNKCLLDLLKATVSGLIINGYVMFLDDNLAGENHHDTAVKSSREVNDQL